MIIAAEVREIFMYKDTDSQTQFTYENKDYAAINLMYINWIIDRGRNFQFLRIFTIAFTCGGL